jgi:phosphatidylglycerol:prolipoprotein diacylglycerol transferase
MRQILFRIPLKFGNWLPAWWPDDLPVYGFGTMLVVALFVSVWWAGRRAQREGIAKELIQDLAFWLVIAGIIGARTVFMIQYGQPIEHFFYFWEGGLVFYGSLIGGVAGYLLAWFFLLRRRGISGWKLADVIAPAAALGICLGRFGCLLNGCCYGDVACPHCLAVQFPFRSFAWGDEVRDGYQTAAGFTMSSQADDKRTVGAVDPGSPAARVGGLKPGDVIVGVREQRGSREIREPIRDYSDFERYLLRESWPRGKTDLQLTVQRGNQENDLPPFTPLTLGLHPTQLYESISMLLLFALLEAYYPWRRHDGEVMALFLTAYPIHRFINEMLRNDTKPVALGMTLSMNGSLLILAVAAGLWVWLLRKPAQYHPVLVFRGENA